MAEAFLARQDVLSACVSVLVCDRRNDELIEHSGTARCDIGTADTDEHHHYRALVVARRCSFLIDAQGFLSAYFSQVGSLGLSYPNAF